MERGVPQPATEIGPSAFATADAPGGFQVLRGHVQPGHGHRARGRGDESGDHAQGGRLSRAVRTEKSKNLTLLHFKRQVLYDNFGTVSLGYGF